MTISILPGQVALFGFTVMVRLVLLLCLIGVLGGCLKGFYISILYNETSVSTLYEVSISEQVLQEPLTKNLYYLQLYAVQ